MVILLFNADAWWHRDVETFSILLALSQGNSQPTHLKKLLSKLSRIVGDVERHDTSLGYSFTTIWTAIHCFFDALLCQAPPGHSGYLVKCEMVINDTDKHNADEVSEKAMKLEPDTLSGWPGIMKLTWSPFALKYQTLIYLINLVFKKISRMNTISNTVWINLNWHEAPLLLQHMFIKFLNVNKITHSWWMWPFQPILNSVYTLSISYIPLLWNILRKNQPVRINEPQSSTLLAPYAWERNRPKHSHRISSSWWWILEIVPARFVDGQIIYITYTYLLIRALTSTAV